MRSGVVIFELSGTGFDEKRSAPGGGAQESRNILRTDPIVHSATESIRL